VGADAGVNLDRNDRRGRRLEQPASPKMHDRRKTKGAHIEAAEHGAALRWVPHPVGDTPPLRTSP
jgi:hypothetical protein